MQRYIFTFFVLLCISNIQAADLRNWTGSNGKVIEAEFVAFDGKIVKLKNANGKELNVLLSLFSREDQEFVKNGGKETSDDPFGENSTAQNQLKDGEVIRVTLDISETGDCKLQLVRTSKPPQDDFKGRDIKLTLLPNTKIRVNDEGLTNFVYDFKEKVDPIFPWMRDWTKGQDVDEEKKLFIMTPPQDSPYRSFMTLIGFMPDVWRFPVRIVYDVVQFNKEVFNSEFIFHKTQQIFSCRINCQSGINSPFSISCRWGTGGGKDDWNFRDLYRQDNISLSLDKPIQYNFRFPLPNTIITESFRYSVGRNLNIGQDLPDKESSGISRLEFTGHYFPKPLSFKTKLEGNDTVVGKFGPNSLVAKAGIEEGDILYSVNGIRCSSPQTTKEILNNLDISKPLTIQVKRNGQFKDIPIFEQIK